MEVVISPIPIHRFPRFVTVLSSQLQNLAEIKKKELILQIYFVLIPTKIECILQYFLCQLSIITIDENAVGTLDRCMAHENFAELIESIEKDFPDGFFDSFPNSDNTESLHETVFDAVSSQSNEAQQVAMFSITLQF